MRKEEEEQRNNIVEEGKRHTREGRHIAGDALGRSAGLKRGRKNEWRGTGEESGRGELKGQYGKGWRGGRLWGKTKAKRRRER